MSHPEDPKPGQARRRLVLSYVTDWLTLIVIGVVGYVLGSLEPRRRPFSLEDRNISFPFTSQETVPAAVAILLNSVVPLIIILIVTLVFVPGPMLPKGTIKSIYWRRKLWELHTGWLGLGLSVASAWFITNAMKNMFGKPRPDLLSRCEPDVENVGRYMVGGIANVLSNGQLVSASICTNNDFSKLQDGFRSFPSGHASSSSAGLVYLSLFLCSKFRVTIPSPGQPGCGNHHTFSAFPYHLRKGRDIYEPMNSTPNGEGLFTTPAIPVSANGVTRGQAGVSAARREFAAPPIYLLVIAALPVFLAVFIAGSRWFDFRHHAFDIMFGFMIGLITAVFAFRYYHQPISRGTGWSWGPRTPDKAFWAGVGSISYATHGKLHGLQGDEEEALETKDTESRNPPSDVPSMNRG